VRGETLEGALNVRTRAPRAYSDAEIELLVSIADQVAQSIVHAQLYSQAQRRVAELEALAQISEAVSESLYLEESLEAIVKTTMSAVSASGAALVLEDGRIAWPEGRAGEFAVRTPLRWKRRVIGELVADRDSPFSEDDRALLEAIAHHAAVALEHGRAVMRGVLAQEIHHRVKNNLQTVASLLRLQSRAEGVDPKEALEHSVNRILAIAAVHEVLTEQRDEDVEIAELIDRLRAMLIQGLAAGRSVEASLQPVSIAGVRATCARPRLQRAPAERARARLRLGAHRARTAKRRRRARDRRRRHRAGRRARGNGPLDRRRARCATSCRAHSRSAPTAERGPRWCSPRDAAGERENGAMRILIAEDETIIRLDLRDMLVRAGFDVCAEARDGEEAVELARTEQPDLAIMDVKMPKLDGIDAARRILEERPIPIVMLTAYDQTEIVSRAVEAGVYGYLVKPFREQDLLPAIQSARARHDELQALRAEAESLADALASRKAIERAKGLLMEKEGLNEADAFARLRKASQVSGRPLKVIAEAVVATLGTDT